MQWPSKGYLDEGPAKSIAPANIRCSFVWKPLPQPSPHKGIHISSMTRSPPLSCELLKDMACILFLLMSTSQNCTHQSCPSPGPAPSRCLAQSRGFNKCLWDAWMEKWMDFMNPHTANLEFVILWRQDIYWVKVWKKYSNLGFYCLCSSLLRNASLLSSSLSPHYFPHFTICRIITTQETAFF